MKSLEEKGEEKRILFAGGGTGGHILAGVAVADAWRAKWGKDCPVLFVGAEGGIEERLVPRAGYTLNVLRIGSLNQVSLSRKVRTAIQLPLAFFKAAAILMRFRPRYVLGVGGYSSGPLVLMARILHSLGLLRLRIGILEQNAIPGFTNRILSRFTHFIFTAFPGTESRFPNNNVVLTGNPIRSSMKPMPSAARDPFTIFIFGGSQGALGINSLVLDALKHLEDLKKRLKFIHQTGEKDFERVREGHLQAGTQSRVEKFIYEMPAAYAESSLLICRTGSSTLAEVAAVGRASVLIPLPTAADNHQEKNARVFSDAGAATLLLQRDSRGEDLAKVIREFVENPSRIVEMEKKVTQFFRPHAAEDVVLGLVQ